MIFGEKWIREKAKEILEHDNVSIILESPGKVKIIADRKSNNIKFQQFKNVIENNIPLGAEVTIYKLN